MFFNKDKRFDISLKVGEFSEQNIADILTNKNVTIEVKSEQSAKTINDKKWDTTNNIFVEYESRGLKSGIATTDADYWWIALQMSDEYKTWDVGHMVFPVAIFQKLIQKMMHHKDENQRWQKRNGGDGGTSKGILIPIETIWKNLATIKQDLRNGTD